MKCIRAALVGIMLIVVLSGVKGQSADFSSAKAAIKNLVAISNQASNVSFTIDNTNFNFTLLYTNCSYCSYAWGKLCWTHASAQYAWNFTEFPSFISTFNANNTKIVATLGQFSPSYAKLKGSLSEFTSINKLIQDVLQGGYSNLPFAVDLCLQKLTYARGNFDSAVAGMYTWQKQMVDDLTLVQANYSNLQTYINTANNSFQSYLSNINCGQTELTNQWEASKNNITSLMSYYSNNLNSYGLSVQNLNTDFSYFGGVVINAINLLESVNRSLVNGSSSDNEAIMRLKTASALKDLNAFSQFLTGVL